MGNPQTFVTHFPIYKHTVFFYVYIIRKINKKILKILNFNDIDKIKDKINNTKIDILIKNMIFR